MLDLKLHVSFSHIYWCDVNVNLVSYVKWLHKLDRCRESLFDLKEFLPSVTLTLGGTWGSKDGQEQIPMEKAGNLAMVLKTKIPRATFKIFQNVPTAR